MKQYQTDFTLDRKQRSLLFMSSVSGTRSNSGDHDTGGSEEKIHRVFQTGVEPMTFT